MKDFLCGCVLGLILFVCFLPAAVGIFDTLRYFLVGTTTIEWSWAKVFFVAVWTVITCPAWGPVIDEVT